jgi:hypothetical protein
MSETGLEDELQACLDHPDRFHLVRAAVAFDFRHVGRWAGDRAGAGRGTEKRAAIPDFIGRLARTVTDWPVPLKRRGRFDTDDQGRIRPEEGRRPARRQPGPLLRDLERDHDLGNAGPAGGRGGHRTPRSRAGHQPARGILTRWPGSGWNTIAACLRDGHPLDNLIEPETLPSCSERHMREALQEVAEQQKKMSSYAPLGV